MGQLVSIGMILIAAATTFAQKSPRASVAGPESSCSVLVGRPTDRSATVSVLSDSDGGAFVEYGVASGAYTSRTEVLQLRASVPVEFELVGLMPDSECFYRLSVQRPSQPGPVHGTEQRFHTARKLGATFTFCIQGDSHPERIGRMYDPDLYVRTLTNVAVDKPDFYFTMGDDFSIERLFEQKSLSQSSVDATYAHQRGFLGIVGKSTSLMLVNGNHEQAAKYLLDGTANNGAAFAGVARTTFYPLPTPGSFYTGNAEPVEHIGLLRDYYAWEGTRSQLLRVHMGRCRVHRPRSVLVYE